MRIIVVVSLLLLNAYAYSAEWRGPYKYKKFEPGLVAGHEGSGEIVYIGLVHSSKVSISDHIDKKNESGVIRSKPKISSDGSWIVGKVAEQYRGISYADDRYEEHHREYFIFNPLDHKAYEWRSYSDGDYPKNAISIWGDPNGGLICRARWADTLLPGTFYPKQLTCNIAYGGRTRKLFVYELLTKKE